MADHDQNVKNLLERARAKNLKLNAEKFNFRKTKVKFAGYILTDTGHTADPEKVRAIIEMPAPKDVEGVRRFLGMVNYFSKYLSNLSKLSDPLRQLTSDKIAWQWGPEQDNAFESLKRTLATAPLLAFFHPECGSTVVQCDASKEALGAVLLQDGRPIMFASRTLSRAEENYAQIEKELLAVVFAMERFDHYTYGRHVTVESDHRPLEVILKKPIVMAPKRLQRMLLRLQRYTFQLKYSPGSQVLVADALSRAPTRKEEESDQADLEAVCAVTDADLTDPMLLSLQPATDADKTMKKVKIFIQDGWPVERKELPPDVMPYYHIHDELVYEKGIILKGERFVIPQVLRKEMLEELHRPHMGLESTLRRARETVFWPLMTTQLKDFIRRCDTCRTMDPQQQKEPLVCHEVVKQVWGKIGVDLFQHKGRDLITVDYLTNSWEVDHLNRDTSSSNVIRKLKMNFARYGIPQVLVSDNGPQFISKEFKLFTKNWGMLHELSSPYHPQSNGKAESAVKTVKSLMSKAEHSGSDLFLMLLEYRNTPTQALGSSPAQRMLCRSIRSKIPVRVDALQQKPVEMDDLATRLERTQKRQAESYNQGAKALPPLEAGQEVRICLIERPVETWTNQESNSCTVVHCADGHRCLFSEKSSGHQGSCSWQWCPVSR